MFLSHEVKLNMYNLPDGTEVAYCDRVWTENT